VGVMEEPDEGMLSTGQARHARLHSAVGKGKITRPGRKGSRKKLAGLERGRNDRLAAG